MGIREKVNQNPGIGIAVAVVLVVACSVEAYRFFFAGPSLPKASSTAVQTEPPAAYFTIDDGKTCFAAGSSRVAPFDYNGKQAVKAYLFDIGGKKVVGYMEKTTAGAGTPLLVKKPGQSEWIPDTDPRAQAVKNVGAASAVQAPNN